jgi:hypothetical protein
VGRTLGPKAYQDQGDDTDDNYDDCGHGRAKEELMQLLQEENNRLEPDPVGAIPVSGSSARTILTCLKSARSFRAKSREILRVEIFSEDRIN